MDLSTHIPFIVNKVIDAELSDYSRSYIHLTTYGSYITDRALYYRNRPVKHCTLFINQNSLNHRLFDYIYSIYKIFEVIDNKILVDIPINYVQMEPPTKDENNKIENSITINSFRVFNEINNKLEIL